MLECKENKNTNKILLNKIIQQCKKAIECVVYKQTNKKIK